MDGNYPAQFRFDGRGQSECRRHAGQRRSSIRHYYGRGNERLRDGISARPALIGGLPGYGAENNQGRFTFATRIHDVDRRRQAVRRRAFDGNRAIENRLRPESPGWCRQIWRQLENGVVA
jgi:hypothetical protein